MIARSREGSAPSHKSLPYLSPHRAGFSRPFSITRRIQTPTYIYRCTSCGTAEERVLTLREYDDPQTCSCGSPMERGWDGSAPGIQFKGRGWTPKHYGQKGRR